MSLPALIVTGASGFLGRHLLDDLKDEYRIFGIARRSQRECGAPVHPNVAWLRVDVADRDGLSRAFREILSAGGARALIHLAAYRDFHGADHPEYRRTNVEGTRNVLEFARGLSLDRLVFASSVEACAFPRKEGAITEATPADGPDIFAWSKRQGEELVRAHRDLIPACIVRLGAVFSDWCENPQLHELLKTWLGRSLRARVVAGRGRTAVPYVHVLDAVGFFRRLLSGGAALEPAEVLLASAGGCTTHLELQRLATRHFFGAPRKPLFLPARMCCADLFLRNGLRRLAGSPPYERSCVRRRIDAQLVADNSRTVERLGWAPAPRHRIERRIPYMIERLKSEPDEWRARNETATRRAPLRPDLRIYRALLSVEETAIAETVERVRSGPGGDRLPNFRAMDREELVWFVRLLYRLLLSSVHGSDRMLILNYLEVTAFRRFRAGFTAAEICLFLDRFDEAILEALAAEGGIEDVGPRLRDCVTVPIEFGKDEVEEQYDRFLREPVEPADRPPDAASARAAPSPRELLEETIWNCLVRRR